MIKYSQLETIFRSNGIDIHEFNLETDEEYDLPFAVYRINDGESFSADGITYYQMFEIALAFFDETLNFAMQNTIENILINNGTYFDKRVNFDAEVRVYSISYLFTVEDDGVDKNTI